MEFETEEYFAAQALPIGMHTAGMEPQDGLQYLSLVHSEASTIPDVMAVDRTKLPCSQGVDTTTSSPCDTAAIQLPPQLVRLTCIVII